MLDQTPCTRCHQPMGGELETLTAISDVGGSAHFWCYYPAGVPDRSLEMTRGGLPRIAALSPERARFFHVRELTHE